MERPRGTLPYDRLLADEDVDFEDWELSYSREHLQGAALDAVNRGNNRIVVTTTNCGEVHNLAASANGRRRPAHHGDGRWPHTVY